MNSDPVPVESGSGSWFVALLMRNFWKLSLVFVVFGVMGYFLGFLMRPAYRAEAVVIPVHNNSAGLLGGLVGGSALGALGIGSNVDKNEPIQIISSFDLLKRFIDEQKLLPILCDARAIKCPGAPVTDSIAQERMMNSAVELFQKRILSVTETTITGVVHVSVIWYDRYLAAAWCNGLIDLTNKTIQDRAEEIAETRVKYLQQEYAQTSVVPLQSAVSTILVNEMTKKLDAATRPEYAWRILNRAPPPDDRFPARPLKSVLALGAGLVAVFLYIMILAYTHRNRRVAR
jgi:uncharacterized protein involved in exopolysaccharide biosynthesis